MKIDWTFKSIPELSTLSRKERGKVYRKSMLKVFLHWETWLALIVFAFLTSIDTQYIIVDLFFYFLGLYFFAAIANHKLNPYLKKEINKISSNTNS